MPRCASIIKADFSCRNALTSGPAQSALDRQTAREFEIRALLVWQAFGRVLHGVRLSEHPGVDLQLKGIVDDFLRTGCDDLIKNYEFTGTLMRSSQSRRDVEPLRKRAYDRVCSEIDISLLSATRSDSNAGSVVNIFQSYGIVQTGQNSTASFAQTFGASEREKLSEALQKAEEAVKNSTEVSVRDSQAFLEVVADARGEIARDQPNFARLRGSLMAIATTVQALGSASQAYQLIKAAATFVGITLP
jgi:hypothetical protein